MARIERRESTPRGGRRTAIGALSFIALLLSMALPVAHAQERTYLTTLYAFKGGRDGAAPIGGLVLDKAGNLYGTTAGNNCGNPYGTVFKLDRRGKQTVLHLFQGGADGEAPFAALIRDANGKLYGTTYGDLGGNPAGNLFEVDATGTYTVLYTFTGGLDGWNPDGALIRDSDGNLYSTTLNGGAYRAGTVFKLDPSGSKTVLHNFTGGNDGIGPFAGLVADSDDNLYGTTGYGGAHGVGIVFKLDSAGNETILHTFAGSDGGAPASALIRDAAGNFYGTTSGGGAYGWGTVYKLDSAGNETVLYSFTGGDDGRFPYGSLIWVADNFYGTTSAGGANGLGTVYKLDLSGNLTLLYTFKGGADGGIPESGLVRDAHGYLYGTAEVGGAYGCGTVFRITP